jgi:hypothetical protein
MSIPLLLLKSEDQNMPQISHEKEILGLGLGVSHRDPDGLAPEMRPACFRARQQLAGVGRLGGQVAPWHAAPEVQGRRSESHTAHAGNWRSICGPHADHGGARVAALPRRHLCVLGDKAEALVSSCSRACPPLRRRTPECLDRRHRRRPPSCHQITPAPRAVLSMDTSTVTLTSPCYAKCDPD